VTPEADLQRVAKAVAFGLRLNGGAVCMSPRRLFANAVTMKALRPLLDAELAKVPPVALPRRRRPACC
jgi:acyl-CoA reductase-like NAD-dependent aldehyde dehydrogenase